VPQPLPVFSQTTIGNVAVLDSLLLDCLGWARPFLKLNHLGDRVLKPSRVPSVAPLLLELRIPMTATFGELGVHHIAAASFQPHL
jgi:hypothetical protein